MTIRAGLLVLACLMGVASYSAFGHEVLGHHKLLDSAKLNAPNPRNFSIEDHADSNLLHILGSLDIGVLAELERMLAKYPKSQGVILDSEGGNIYQSRGLARLIQKHSLDTYSYVRCYSACVIAFLAGNRRYLKSPAKLGFHEYRVDSKLLESLVDIDAEHKKDLEFFKKRIPSAEFLENIYRRTSPKIWVPSMEELLNAGVVHEVLAD